MMFSLTDPHSKQLALEKSHISDFFTRKHFRNVAVVAAVVGAVLLFVGGYMHEALATELKDLQHQDLAYRLSIIDRAYREHDAVDAANQVLRQVAVYEAACNDIRQENRRADNFADGLQVWGAILLIPGLLVLLVLGAMHAAEKSSGS